MSEITKEDVRERLGNIGQIRDIIFGTQIREYNHRLDKLESDLSLFQQELRDRLEQVKVSFTSEHKKSTDSLEKRLKSLSSTLQEENSDLHQQIDRVNKKLASSLEALDETLEAQTTAIRDDLSQTRDNLQGDVSALRDLVFEELNRRFSQLQGHKVSKDDMAEALFEMGMRLKGTEFVPELKKAADASYDSVPLLETRKALEELANGQYNHSH